MAPSSLQRINGAPHATAERFEQILFLGETTSHRAVTTVNANVASKGQIRGPDEFLVPVALHVGADDGTVEDVESGEQRGRAVTFVVVGPGATRLEPVPKGTRF